MSATPGHNPAGASSASGRRGAVVVITEAPQAPGFRLAGVATNEVKSAGAASSLVDELVSRPSPPAVIAVHEPYLERFDPAQRRRLALLTDPLVIALPSGAHGEERETRQSRLARMLWEAVGYEITFDEGARR